MHVLCYCSYTHAVWQYVYGIHVIPITTLYYYNDQHLKLTVVRREISNEAKTQKR